MCNVCDHVAKTAKEYMKMYNTIKTGGLFMYKIGSEYKIAIKISGQGDIKLLNCEKYCPMCGKNLIYEKNENNTLTVNILLKALQRMKDAGFGDTPITINGENIKTKNVYYNYSSKRYAKVNFTYRKEFETIPIQFNFPRITDIGFAQKSLPIIERKRKK